MAWLYFLLSRLGTCRWVRLCTRCSVRTFQHHTICNSCCQILQFGLGYKYRMVLFGSHHRPPCSWRNSYSLVHQLYPDTEKESMKCTMVALGCLERSLLDMLCNFLCFYRHLHGIDQSHMDHRIHRQQCQLLQPHKVGI